MRPFTLVGPTLVAACMSLAACGGGSAAPATTAPTTTRPSTTTAAPTITSTSAVPATTATTAVATTQPAHLQLSALPGRIATVSQGCNGLPSSNDSTLCIFNPDGSSLVEVAPHDGFIEYPAWTWDGTSLLFFTDTKSLTVASDGSGLTSRDDLIAPMPSQSPDGKWMNVERPYKHGFWLSPVGSTKQNRHWRQVVSNPDSCCQFAHWSPDSHSLAYSVGRGSGVCNQLWIVDITSTEARMVVGGASGTQKVCVASETERWSPDGSMLLFLDEGPTGDLSVPMLVRPDGSDLHPLITDSSLLPANWEATGAAWSPDSTAIALSLLHDTGLGLYIVSVDGTQAVSVPGLPPGAIPVHGLSWAPGV
jgi:hypothetical protein